MPQKWSSCLIKMFQELKVSSVRLRFHQIWRSVKIWQIGGLKIQWAKRSHYFFYASAKKPVLSPSQTNRNIHSVWTKCRFTHAVTNRKHLVDFTTSGSQIPKFSLDRLIFHLTMMNIFTQLYWCGCKRSYHLNFIMWAHSQELKVYCVCCKTNISMCADTQHRLTELLFLALQVWTRFLLFKSWQLPILQMIKSLLVSKPKYWSEKKNQNDSKAS